MDVSQKTTEYRVNNHVTLLTEYFWLGGLLTFKDASRVSKKFKMCILIDMDINTVYKKNSSS